jgi:integrase
MSVRKKIVITKGEPVTWWLADYSDNGGVRHQRRFPTKKEAVAFHDQTKVAIRAGTHVSLPDSLTMAHAADRWLKHIEAQGRERATLRQYRQHVVHHIVPRIGGVKLAKLARGHIEHFRDSLISGDKKLSPPMARKVWVSFKSILKHMHLRHLTDNVRIGGGNRDKRPLEVGVDIPTMSEMQRLIAAAANKPKLHALLKVAALTGLRASELRGLRWLDVDLKAGEIHVRQRVDRFNKIGTPKSVSGTRTIPFGPELALALKTWKLACPKGELDLVFPTSDGTALNDRAFTRRLEPVFRAAHLLDKHGKPKYAPHAFRHFFASWCINPKDRGGRELPAKVAQTWLGHSSIKITLDIYGHLFPTGDNRAEIRESEKALLG